MLDSNDIQVINQAVRIGLANHDKQIEEIKMKLKESQQEANSLSAEVCRLRKDIQRLKDLLEETTWLDEGEELVIFTRKEYFEIMNVLAGGSEL